MEFSQYFSGIAQTLGIIQLKVEFTATVGTTKPLSRQESLENLGSQENEIHGHFGCEEKERPLRKDQPMKSRVD